MERARRHLVAYAELGQPGAELARGPAGEGEGEHVAGIGRAAGHAPGDAPGEGPRLARPGAGEDAERGRRAGDGLGLGRVEARQQVGAGDLGYEDVAAHDPTDRTEGVRQKGGWSQGLGRRPGRADTRTGPETRSGPE